MRWDVLPTACAPRVRVFDSNGRVLFSVPCKEFTRLTAENAIDGFLDRREVPTGADVEPATGEKDATAG